MAETLAGLRASAKKANDAVARAEEQLANARGAVVRAADGYHQAVIAWADTPIVAPGKSTSKTAAAASPVDEARGVLDKAMSDFAAVRRSLDV